MYRERSTFCDITREQNAMKCALTYPGSNIRMRTWQSKRYRRLRWIYIRWCGYRCLRRFPTLILGILLAYLDTSILITECSVKQNEWKIMEVVLQNGSVPIIKHREIVMLIYILNQRLVLTLMHAYYSERANQQTQMASFLYKVYAAYMYFLKCITIHCSTKSSITENTTSNDPTEGQLERFSGRSKVNFVNQYCHFLPAPNTRVKLPFLVKVVHFLK